MNKYQNGKIYKIVCNITNEIYIGSTIRTLDKRLIRHVADYKNNVQRKCESYKIIERGNYNIYLIENYSCNGRKELYKREAHWQKEIKCINKYIAYQSKEEKKIYCDKWREDNKDVLKIKKKEYAEKNKIRLKEYHKQHHLEHKEEYRQKAREWREKHKNDEDYKQRRKQYRDTHKEEQKILVAKWCIANKEKIKQQKRIKYEETKHLRKPPLTCGCGGTYEDTDSKKKRHEATKKHINFYL